MKKTKLLIYTLEWRTDLLHGHGKDGGAWVLSTGGAIVEDYDGCPLREARGYAKQRVKFFAHLGQPSELRTRRKDGTFSPAFTYPRSADPRRSKG